MASANNNNPQKKQPSGFQKFLRALIAGGIAGVCEILIMYPTDVVKTRRQLATVVEKVNLFKAIYDIAKNEG